MARKQHLNKSRTIVEHGAPALREIREHVSFRTTTTTVLQHASSTRRSRQLLQIFLNDADKRYLAQAYPSVASGSSDMLRSLFRTSSSMYFGMAKSWSSEIGDEDYTNQATLSPTYKETE